jgi:gliding motility-associated-like protein
LEVNGLILLEIQRRHNPCLRRSNMKFINLLVICIILFFSSAKAQKSAFKQKVSDSIYVYPVVISPNCDPPICTGLFLSVEAEKEVVIFDRWGKKMYEAKTPGNVVWDSKDQEGKLCKAGTYFYLVKVLANGRICELKGNVSVVR